MSDYGDGSDCDCDLESICSDISKIEEDASADDAVIEDTDRLDKKDKNKPLPTEVFFCYAKIFDCSNDRVLQINDL
tara:strand:- start:86 stop:313 length:228 start_codon:yes stop_codon:yes gene_type:complete